MKTLKTTVQLRHERLTQRLWLLLIKAGSAGVEQVSETRFNQGTGG